MGKAGSGGKEMLFSCGRESLRCFRAVGGQKGLFRCCRVLTGGTKPWLSGPDTKASSTLEDMTHSPITLSILSLIMSEIIQLF